MRKHFLSFAATMFCLAVSLFALSSVALADSSLDIDYTCPNCKGTRLCHVTVVGDCLSPNGFTRTSVCSVCSYVDTYDCPYQQDNHSSINAACLLKVLPTCTENGYEKAFCLNCLSYLGIDPNGYQARALGHAWTETRTDPTCTAPGSVVKSCSRCTERETEAISSLGHSWTETHTDPTCTAPGSVVKSCSRCTERETEAISSLGHSWTETHTDPTCTAPGSIAKACSRCEASETETLPALDHDWVEGKSHQPTCTDPGYAAYSCSRCDFSKKETIPALGGSHIWEETSRMEATSTAPGSIEYTCSTCNAARTEVIPVLGPTAPTPGESTTMTGLLATLSAALSAVLDWVGTVSETITANPMLLLCVVVGFIGSGVILFKRFLNI